MCYLQEWPEDIAVEEQVAWSCVFSDVVTGVKGGLPDAWGKESSRSRYRIRLNWSTLDFAGPDLSLSVIVLFQGRTSHRPRSPVCQQDAFQTCSQRFSKALVSMASVTMLDERASGNPHISWNVILTPVHHSPIVALVSQRTVRSLRVYSSCKLEVSLWQFNRC